MNLLKEIVNITVSHVLKGAMHFEDRKDMMHRNMVCYSRAWEGKRSKGRGIKRITSASKVQVWYEVEKFQKESRVRGEKLRNHACRMVKAMEGFCQ